MSAVVPVNVQVPASASAPIVADFVVHALRVAYIARRDVLALPESDWAAPGIYLLMTDDGTRNVYVGKSTDLRSRLIQHRAKQAHVPEWARAIAIKRDTANGFNSAQVGYLEGRLSAELDAIDGLNVLKGKADGDNTLPSHEQLALDALLPSILAAVRLAGLDTYRAQEDDRTARKSATLSGRRMANISGNVEDLLSAGLLQAGAMLYCKRGERVGLGAVSADGEIVVEGVGYAAPSLAAAKSLGAESSAGFGGWEMWRVGSLEGISLATLRSRLTEGDA